MVAIRPAVAAPVPPVIVAPSVAAFAELRRAKVFDAELPKGVNGTNWTSAPTSFLRGITPSTAKALARAGIHTIRDVANLPRNRFDGGIASIEGVSTTALKRLAAAQQLIRASAVRYGVAL